MLAEKTNFTITRMVRLLEVSRSGYYAWAGRVPSRASLRRVHIEQKVAFFYGDSDETYGLTRATLVPCVGGDRVEDRRGVGSGRCCCGDVVPGDADGDVSEGPEGADESTDADPCGVLQVA